jgi:hypothetical protein
MHPNAGISLIEVIVGALLGVGVVLIVAMSLSSSVKQERLGELQTNDRISLVLAQKHIRRVARVASSCSRTPVPGGGTALQCDVDFNIPPTGALTRVRFLPRGTSLRYEHREGAAWVTKQTFPGIAAMVVCDPVMLAANRCPIQPAGLSTAAAPGSSRFFRYQLTSLESRVGTLVTPGFLFSGAFTMRNPASFEPKVFYHYGYRGAR